MADFKDLIKEVDLTLVDFYATWCQPCHMMHPVLMETKQHFGDKLRVITIDIDKNMDLAAQYQVHAVPTLMIFRQGEMVWRQSGAMPYEELVAVVDSMAV